MVTVFVNLYAYLSNYINKHIFQQNLCNPVLQLNAFARYFDQHCSGQKVIYFFLHDAVTLGGSLKQY